MSENENFNKNERRRFNRREAPTSIQGRLPPQDTLVEQAILGAIMIVKDAISDVADVLRSEMFYEDRHQKIFDVVMHLTDQAKPVDILTVSSELSKRGELEMVGGRWYITSLTDRVSSSAHLNHHAFLIVQKFIQRELIRISTEAIVDAYDDTSDALELLDKAAGHITTLQTGVVPGKETMLSSAVMDRLVHYEKIAHLEITGLPSGLSELDRMLGGFQKTDLYILAARPSQGKTSAALTFARNIAITRGEKVGFFSLEMSEGQLIDRLLSMEAQIDLWKLRTPKVMKDYEWSQLHKAAGQISAKDNIIIDDHSTLNISQFRAKARRMKKNHDVQLIIIDYLQLMSGIPGTRVNLDQEIGQITRGLKAVAKSLNIPIIVLAQLSRATEQRAGTGNKPKLSDIRSSGNAEQDADGVIFLHRPEYYGITVDEDNNPTAGMAEFIVAKYRNGETGTAKARWIAKYTAFQNLSDDWDQPSLDLGTKPSNFVIKPSRMYNPDDDESDSPF